MLNWPDPELPWWDPYFESVIEPALIVVSIVAIGLLVVLARRFFRKRAERQRTESGLCPRCGYDLSGTASCPECGMGKIDNAPAEGPGRPKRDSHFWAGQ